MAKRPKPRPPKASKPSPKPKPAPAAVEPAKASASDPTSSLTDEQLQTLLFAHKRKIREFNGRIDELTKLRKEGYALAKAEGVSRKDIDLAIELETDAGIVKHTAAAARLERLTRWMGVKLGSQADLFDTDHYEAGKRAAMNDEPRKPPASLAQKDAQTWMNGHDAGRIALNETRARQFSPIGDAAPTVQ